MINASSDSERVILVHVNFPAGKLQEDLEELKELALSAGAHIVATLTSPRRMPESKYFVGSGKALEIRDAVSATDAELVIFNHILTPAQERNLEQLCQCRVIDRTGLILDIFAQHALTFEGKLQVELAQLTRLSTRLVRGWSHLERQRGGIGLRGPGETQLESDRRLIRNKIKQISARLTKLRKQRELSRHARRKAAIPTVALVGYTNVGKSTLFNRLTGASIYTANQLFATLDATFRRINLPEIGPVIFADTVGFIRHLPHDLIESFKATLEEVSAADLLLHVVDAQDEKRLEHIAQVNHVLVSIKADTVPLILVYNKIDLTQEFKPETEYDEEGHIKRVFISAAKNLGILELEQAIRLAFRAHLISQQIILLPTQAKLRAELYELNAVLSESIDEVGNHHLNIRLPRVELERLFR